MLLSSEHMVKWADKRDDFVEGTYIKTRTLVIKAWGGETLRLEDADSYIDSGVHTFTFPIIDPSAGIDIEVQVNESGQAINKKGEQYKLSSSRSEGIFDSTFSEYAYHFTLKESGNGYRFEYPGSYQNNLQKLQIEVRPEDCLGGYIADSVKEKAAEIVGSETDPYQKMYLLFKWISINIQYDYGYLYGYGPGYTCWTPEDVLANRLGVCEGFAKLLCAMARSQGIPAIVTSCYGTGGEFTGENITDKQYSNHAYTEAFINGRWVQIDATWYQDISGFEYFDASYPAFSNSHKIMTRPVDFP